MSFTRLYKFLSPLLLSLVLFVVMACSSDKLIPDGKYLLDKVELRSDKKDINTSLLMQYVHQKGNSRWFSLFKIPLGAYAVSYTHLRAHETAANLVCRLLLEKKKC